jgi:hypothetical protein
MVGINFCVNVGRAHEIENVHLTVGGRGGGRNFGEAFSAISNFYTNPVFDLGQRSTVEPPLSHTSFWRDA